ncbi:5'-methylthioadenosine nucleosidase [Aliivibrio fischeri]|uniref:5'-methylthioadenosine/S-adenosylhomocysteine nucleosidase n=1 Tax=Aliivibrio fischeri TaxID=668 RepID=UPI0012DAB1A7|nr:5'-methylthioadenosine/S-adenosylhomocysteine nucleosidase [Aliivibrio fischeri]MUJ27385.1 5'-methylthioadenosine nucleosidase [Aliivibrio fischeri]
MRSIKTVFLFFIMLSVSFFSMAEMKSVTVKGNAQLPLKPIIIQGPMPIEAQHFAALLDNVVIEKSGLFVFYKGTLNGYPVIVSQTGKGLENTAAATAIAIERYSPIAIINQGTSGGHDKNLNVADIVLGKRTVNIGNLKAPKAPEGKGSNSLTWIPMDIMASSGSAGGDDANKIRYYEGSSALISSAHKVKYNKGKVVEGTIGSANFWNNELDRINWFHTNFGTSTEEMESASAAQISEAYKIPFLAIRILSNNATNGGHYNPNTAKYCQSYVKDVVIQYISDLNLK